MTIETILPFLNDTRKGQIVTLHTNRPAKVRKGAPSFTKVSVYQVRVGHEYENQASTKAAREAGMGHREEADDYAKRLNEHLSFNKENGRVYLSCQPIQSNVKSAVFIDAVGNVKTKAEVSEHLLASELRTDPSIHIRGPLDTITEIK